MTGIEYETKGLANSVVSPGTAVRQLSLPALRSGVGESSTVPACLTGVKAGCVHLCRVALGQVTPRGSEMELCVFFC